MHANKYKNHMNDPFGQTHSTPGAITILLEICFILHDF